MNRFLLFPLGLLLASSAHAQTVQIPLPPPTPLGGTDFAGGTSAAMTTDSSLPTAMIALKPAAKYSDAELRAMGTGVAFPYELLDGVLHRYVDKNGNIYYLKARGDNDLETFARAVAVADLGQFPVFTGMVSATDPKKGTFQDHTAELTFWINAYNGLRIKAIADRYPGVSNTMLKQLDTAKDQTVAGQTYSFAELRKKIAGMDARALFALMSGVKDGPSAPTSVFRYSRLNDQLNQAVRAFVNDPNKVSTPDRLANSVEASPFLAEVDTYFKPAGDRHKNAGIRTLLSRYTKNSGARGYFTTGEYAVRFSLANDKLNEKIGS